MAGKSAGNGKTSVDLHALHQDSDSGGEGDSGSEYDVNLPRDSVVNVASEPVVDLTAIDLTASAGPSPAFPKRKDKSFTFEPEASKPSPSPPSPRANVGALAAAFNKAAPPASKDSSSKVKKGKGTPPPAGKGGKVK